MVPLSFRNAVWLRYERVLAQSKPLLFDGLPSIVKTNECISSKFFAVMHAADSLGRFFKSKYGISCSIWRASALLKHRSTVPLRPFPKKTSWMQQTKLYLFNSSFYILTSQPRLSQKKKFYRTFLLFSNLDRLDCGARLAWSK